jgi:class 3 adenylate cyclase
VPLGVHIGIDSGPAAGGIIGCRRFSYHLSGETVKVAAALARQRPVDSIWVSERIHAATDKLYRFGSPAELALETGESFAAWPLKSFGGREPEPPPAGAKAETGFDEGDPNSVPARSNRS